MCSYARGRGILRLVAGSMFLVAQLAVGEQRGVVDDPAGSVELRAGKSADAEVVATIKAGEPFSFVREKDDDEWCKVTLASGKTGWLPVSAIRLYFDAKDLPAKDPGGLSEIDEAAQARGFDYVAETRKAARGDPKALRRFFSLAQEADGAAAESITSVPTIVYHLLGDTRFAKFLADRPLAEQAMVRNVIVGDGRLPPTALYLSRHFPETAGLLFRREILGWPSPDGRFAIRKTFSDELDHSAGKVVRAELVEKKTGEVLCDLTADDIGTGWQREGTVLWSPDSRRFASLSIDLTMSPGNLFSTPNPKPQRKVTSIYQVTGGTWGRIDLPLDKVPGREKDTELQGAVLGHEFTEPVRWQKPGVLILERHEY